jgi:hypothetical protein
VDKHKHGEHDEMQTSQGFGQSLVVSGQSAEAEAVEPAEAALHRPTTWQQFLPPTSRSVIQQPEPSLLWREAE